MRKAELCQPDQKPRSPITFMPRLAMEFQRLSRDFPAISAQTATTS
jgi:hypothetical protein